MKVTCTSVPLTILDETTLIASDAQAVPSGKLVGVTSEAGALDDSDTYTVKIVDAYGITIYEESGLAESTTTIDFYDTSTESFPMNIPCVGPVTITVTASAKQSDAAVEFIVNLYIES
jgi:hypothetical protein